MSVTVTVQGQIKLYPPLLVWYLGFTIVVLPPIIVAACMSYNYCPKIRRRERQERIRKWKKELKNTQNKLRHMCLVEVTLISEAQYNEDERKEMALKAQQKEMARKEKETRRRDREI